MRVNIPIALLSLALSLTLWLMVYGQDLPQPKSFTITHVTYISKDTKFQQHWFVYLPSSVNINVEATSEKLDEIAGDIKDLDAIINLDRPADGTNPYPFTLSSDMIAKLMTDKHPTWPVTVEKVTENRVQVKVVPLGNWALTDWKLTSWTLSRKDVVVRGPRTQVAKVDRVRADLDLGQITATTNEPQIVPLTAMSGGSVVSNVRMSPDAVSITPILTPAPKERKVRVTPKFIGQPAEGFVLKSYDESQKVTVTGPPNVIAGLTNVETEPIDITGINAPKTFKAKLNLPFGISCAHPTVSVRFLAQPNPNYRKPAATTPSPTNTQPPFGNFGTTTTAGSTGTTTGRR